MKRTEFTAKTKQEKIEYITSNNKTVFDLLKIDINSLDESNLVHLFDLTETYSTLSDQTKALPEKLNAVAVTATGQFQDALNKTEIPEDVKDTVIGYFKMLIVPALTGCSKYVQSGLEKASGHMQDRIKNAGVYEKIVAVGIVDILAKTIEFRKKIDSQFPGWSDTIIAAASAGLVNIIGVYSPAAAQIIKSLKLVEGVQSFLKVENLEGVLKNINTKLEEINQDKLLAEIQKTGEKNAELAAICGTSAEAVQKIGFDQAKVEKAITQANSQPNTKEFIKYICTLTDQMPTTSTDSTKKFKDLETSIIKVAANNLNAADMKKFEVVLKEKMLEAEKIYGKTFEKDKNVFEKIVYAQTSSQFLVSSLSEFKSKLPIDSQGRATTKVFEKETKALVQQALPNIGQDVSKQAKKAPIFAKELGLDLKMELKINKFAQQGAAR